MNNKESFGSHINSIGRISEKLDKKSRFKSKIPESFYNASLKTILTDDSSGRFSNREIITQEDDLISPSKMKMLAILGATGGMYFGYYTTIFNPLQKPLLQGVYKFKGNDYIKAQGDVNLIFSLGAILGCLFSGFLGDRVGRMKTLILGIAIEIVCYSLYSIENYYILLVSRY